MRSRLLFGISALLLAVGVSGCKDNAPEEPKPRRIKNMRLNTLDDPQTNVSSRVSMDETYKFTWVLEDIVHMVAQYGASFDVTPNEGLQEYFTTSDMLVNGVFGTSEGIGLSEETQYVPIHVGRYAGGIAPVFADNMITYTLPEMLIERENSNPADFQFFVAPSRVMNFDWDQYVVETNFNWTKTMSLLKVNLTNNSAQTFDNLRVGSIMITGSDLKSTVEVTPRDDEGLDISYTGPAGYKFNINTLALATTVGTTQTEFIPIVPTTTDARLLITAGDAGNRIFYTEKRLSQKEILPGKVIPVNVSITDWTPSVITKVGDPYPHALNPRGVVISDLGDSWLVMSLKEQNKVTWGAANTDIPGLPLVDPLNSSYPYPNGDNGLENTRLIYNFYTTTGGATASSYGVFEWIYGQFAKTSEWYLPSVNAMVQIVQNAATINKTLSAAKGDLIRTTAQYRYITSSAIGPGTYVAVS